MAHLRHFVLALLVPTLTLAGCARRSANPPVAAGEPLSLQMLRTEAQLRKYPFRTLLEFEAATDPVFVRIDGIAPKLDQTRCHTGTSSLLLGRGTKSMIVRLPSLFTTDFPGRWALTGAYFYAPEPQQLTADYVVGNTPLTSITVKLPANQWTPVLLDVASVADGKNAPTGLLRFTFSNALATPLWCDDVLVMDNSETLVDSRSSNGGWLVRERGFQVTLEHPNLFNFSLQTPEATPQGWVLQEANDIRACFTSAGKDKSRIIYSNGLQLLDGKPMPLSPSLGGAFLQQHAAPAEITIAPEMGRLVRNSAGDSNNDGYCELTGTYQILAAAARLELTITPQTPTLTQPVLEIAKLPAGQILAHMEGRP
ncbi:MAG: hypothetical protein ACM359_12390, partial [Bacillota bacterium]